MEIAMRPPSRRQTLRRRAAPRFEPPPGVALRLGRAGLELVDATGVSLPAFQQALLFTGVSLAERRALRAKLLKQAPRAGAAEATPNPLPARGQLGAMRRPGARAGRKPERIPPGEWIESPHIPVRTPSTVDGGAWMGLGAFQPLLERPSTRARAPRRSAPQ